MSVDPKAQFHTIIIACTVMQIVFQYMILHQLSIQSDYQGCRQKKRGGGGENGVKYARLYMDHKISSKPTGG